jgi:outer membrane protein TolC
MNDSYRMESTAPVDRVGAEADTLFASADTLGRGELVAAVLARNPDLEAAREAWGAALARYPQARSLSDPMLRYELAPGSIGSDVVDFGQVIQLRQDFPFPGTLGLRGDIALAEAEAVRGDYQAVRVRLAALASNLYDRYYFLDRALAVNAELISLMDDVQASAASRYSTGRAEQTEPLRAEVASAHLTHRRMELAADREVIAARLNSLLHRPLDAPLPPSPSSLPVPEPDPGGDLLPSSGDEHPELQAATARVRAAQAEVDLAGRNAWPDLGVLATYNSMWAMPEHQWMVGVVLNLPLWGGTRNGEREEARARLGAAEATRTSLADDLGFRERQARERLREAMHIISLYRDRLLPATRDEVAAVRSAFQTGRSTFSDLLEAEQTLRDVELEYEEAVVSYYRARAELADARGVPAFLPPEVTP